MDKLTGLLKEHRVGEWCKRAAWIIAAIGLIEIALTLYTLISQLQQTGPDYPSSPAWDANIVYANLTSLFVILAQFTFFFFALYAAGAFLNHFVSDTQQDNEEEEDELIVEEEDAYLQPGQFTEKQ